MMSSAVSFTIWVCQWKAKNEQTPEEAEDSEEEDSVEEDPTIYDN